MQRQIWNDLPVTQLWALWLPQSHMLATFIFCNVKIDVLIAYLCIQQFGMLMALHNQFISVSVSLDVLCIKGTFLFLFWVALSFCILTWQLQIFPCSSNGKNLCLHFWIHFIHCSYASSELGRPKLNPGVQFQTWQWLYNK